MGNEPSRRGEPEGARRSPRQVWRLLIALVLCAIGLLWMWRHDSVFDSPIRESAHLEKPEIVQAEEAVDPADPIGAFQGAEHGAAIASQPGSGESGSAPEELLTPPPDLVRAVDPSSDLSQPSSAVHGNEDSPTTEDGSSSGPVEPLAKETAPRQGARKATTPKGLFTDITVEAGIDFEYRNGARGDKLLPETMGGGVAFVDLLDQDGDPDLLFVGGSSWTAFEGKDPEPAASIGLFRNDGKGRFEDVTAESGLDVTLYGMGPAVGDIDGDQDLDLFITAVGGHRLFRNDDGFFVDITASAGLAGIPEPGAGSTDPSSSSENPGAVGALANRCDLFRRGSRRRFRSLRVSLPALVPCLGATARFPLGWHRQRLCTSSGIPGCPIPASVE